MMEYHPPLFNQSSFNCPLCGVYADQTWAMATYRLVNISEKVTGIYVSHCAHCEELSYWYRKKLIIPSTGSVELPNPDMPEDCKADYLEARDIVNMSARGSTALLRLCIQKLMINLGQAGKNINDDIKNLVKDGLSPRIQQSLDICRVIGNNAVHPGEINLQDTPEICNSLFRLINFIVNDRITTPNEISNLYSNLPAGALIAIDKRDNK